MSPRRAPRLAIPLVAALIVAGCDGGNEYKPPPPPKVTVAKPEVRTVTDYLDFTGNTAAFNTVTLVARVEGYLEKIHFQDGQRVKTGDLLFTIQQNTYQAEVQRAQSEVLAQKAKLEYAETEFKRYTKLFAQNAAPATQVDQFRYDRDSAKAAVLGAQAQEELAQLNLDYTTVRAPFDGRMGRRLIDVGNLVGVGGQDTKLAQINMIDPIYVYFTINERDLLRVQGENAKAAELGEKRPDEQVLSFGLADTTDFPHQGKLDFAAITVNPETGTLLLRGIFPNPKYEILPGLFARVRAPLGDRPNALLVPVDAISFDQQGRYVLVVNDKNVVERRSVSTGQRVDDKQVIESGLTPDDWVVVDGVMRAIPGRDVTPERAAAKGPPPGKSG